MSKITVFIGVMLCVLGFYGYSASEVKSVTAFIPLFVGLPIAICGGITMKKPSLSVIFMHIALTLALLGFVASLMKALQLDEFGSVKSVSLWSMCVLCFILLGAYMQSFIKARSNKEG
ncbi:hypothetical protein P3T73_13920 [Kiritimatiellota bacterium B12222]|nr:hypothetical protein P3T73_13920 [Kiritimatiellota bacterium B12222]